MEIKAISELRKKLWYEKDGEHRLFLFRDVDGVFYYQTETDIKSKKITGTTDPTWWIGSRRVYRN